MSCLKSAVCHFAQKKSTAPLTPARVQAFADLYCNGDARGCALYVVIDKLGFLKCPKDLAPNEMSITT